MSSYVFQMVQTLHCLWPLTVRWQNSPTPVLMMLYNLWYHYPITILILLSYPWPPHPPKILMLALWQEHDVTDPDQRSLPSAFRTWSAALTPFTWSFPHSTSPPSMNHSPYQGSLTAISAHNHCPYVYLCFISSLLRMSYVWFAGGDNNPIDDIHGVGSVKTKASNGVTNAQILEWWFCSD